MVARNKYSCEGRLITRAEARAGWSWLELELEETDSREERKRTSELARTSRRVLT